LKEIRVLGIGDYFYHRVKNSATRYSRLYTLASVLTSTPRNLLELVLVYFVVILVIVTVFYGGNVALLIPTLGMFGVASLRLLPAFSVFSSGIISLRFSRNSVSSLYNDLSHLRSIKSITDNINETDGKPFQSLCLSNVSYYYPGAKHNSLDKVSLKFNAGEKIGVIGTSGSGKTTLIDMLLGLIAPSSGSISYNKAALPGDLARWQAQVAYLPQEVFLTDDTLRHNIALGVENEKIDNDSLNQAINQSHLQDLVTRLPQGVNTYLGEKGIKLSGGQRQRIALARAFYHGREILIMDEATSALDSETEHKIMEEIKTLCYDKTLIIIAHRMSTLRYCDRIIQMENGNIVSEGSYTTMIKRKSKFLKSY
jgi:ABC-type multidrug transport system fused ATPase/permease subunit